jgi:general secretion pathway protein G
MRRFQRGMAFSELMIAGTVAALIAAVGVRGVKGYMNHAETARAIGDIGSISLQLYRWQSNTRRFPDTLAEAGLDRLVDPWGNPYRYVNVATAKTDDVRRDRNLRPLNTDFDLYSLGPDGGTQSQLVDAEARDDIVRANDGRFVGVAQDY